ncbi:CopG family transcriptional regulator [Microbacteriaceae bacterium VKM Ac-2854]|nr:CopG family transcriptional regulator [Microbacteriaceae bacterium VKM Ac-2854]
MAMTLRLTDEQEKTLSALADAQGISKQEATVRAIVEAADRRLHQSDVARLSEKGRARYADLLKRLGE